MVKRVKLGIIYSYNENWIGGTYYILNLIKLLNKLGYFKRPEIYVFYNDIASIDQVKLLNYPHIRYISIQDETYVKQSELEFNFFQRILNFLTRIIISRNLFSTLICSDVCYNCVCTHNCCCNRHSV